MCHERENEKERWLLLSLWAVEPPSPGDIHTRVGSIDHRFCSALPPLKAMLLWNGYFHLKITPKIITIICNQSIKRNSFLPMLIWRFPCSQSSQTSRYLFGSSVITPSSSCLMHHLIIASSLTVQAKTGLRAAFASRKNLLPMGPMSTFWRRLKDIFGVVRN